MTLVNRDPFARQEIHREREYQVYRFLVTPGERTSPPATMPGCSWCGNVKRTPKGRPYVYRYSVQTDGGRMTPIAGEFCSESCRKSYQS